MSLRRSNTFSCAMLLVGMRALTTAAQPWGWVFDGPGDETLVDVAPAPDGGIYAVGSTSSWGAGGQDGWIMRLDPAGNVIWQEAIGTAGWDSLENVQACSAGGVLAVLRTDLAPSATIVRIADDGTLAWAVQPTGAAFASGAPLGNGHFLGAGRIPTSPTGSACWTVELDETGALVGQQAWPLGDGGSCGQAVASSDGSVFVAASSVDDQGVDGRWYSTRLLHIGGGSGSCLASSENNTFSGELVPTFDGGVLCNASRSSLSGYQESFFQKIDASGSALWAFRQDRYTCPNFMRHYAATSDGGAIVRASGSDPFFCMVDGRFRLDATGLARSNWNQAWPSAKPVGLPDGDIMLVAETRVGSRAAVLIRMAADGQATCENVDYRGDPLPRPQSTGASPCNPTPVAAGASIVPVDLVVTPTFASRRDTCDSIEGIHCADGMDNDRDGLTDCADADCTADPACSDVDGDGRPDDADCLPLDASVFDVPPEVPRLEVLKPAGTMDAALSWTDVSPLAGVSTTSSVASDLLSRLLSTRIALGARVAGDLTVTSYLDSRAVANDGFWYLVRSETACGPPAGLGWGSDSLGTPRPGCP